jgi:proline iminopeptidase
MKHHLWPPIKPYNHFFLNRDNHNIYIEECGNPEGLPIIVLHGGPGGGCQESHRQLFDPSKFRVVLFDQRGCGRSEPHASLDKNTPLDLVNDIEAIREQLNINQFILFGGSWGTTLALLYAISFPKQVSSMILRGVFLGGKAEIDWIYEEKGCARFHPESYDEFSANIPNKNNVLDVYYERLLKFDPASAQAWARWEAINSAIHVSDKTIASFEEPKLAMGLARISCHFFVNNLFLDQNHIQTNLNKINHIKTFIVQGRHDLLCPPEAAHELASSMHNVSLKIVDKSGHSLFEPDTLREILKILSTY